MSAPKSKMASLEDDVDEVTQPDAPVEVMTLRPKVSVALTPGAYYQLVDFCAAAAKARGKRITHVEVFRALAAELFADEALRKRIILRLRGEHR